MVSINNNGDLYSCQHLVNYPEYKMGNIKTGINDDLFKKTTTVLVDNIEKCNDCWAKYLCSGGCFSEKLLCGNKTSDPLDDDSCKYEKVKWDCFLELYYDIKTQCPEYFKEKKDEERINC